MWLRARQLRKRDAKELVAEYPGTRRWMRYEVKARDIARWNPSEIVRRLNEEAGRPATKRVSRFIHLFNRARELNDSFRLFFESKDDMFEFFGQGRSPSSRVAAYSSNPNNFGTGWTFKIPEMQALNSQLNRVLTELNQLARRYRWHPLIRHTGFEMPTFDVTETWDGRGTDRTWETHAIWWLCGNRAKWIDYFRQCRDCNRWFFALAEHQSYCGDSCRKRHASQSEEFKEKRRLYMRTYRRTEGERDERAKNAARREHREASRGAK
jgi:hypothetical protein